MTKYRRLVRRRVEAAFKLSLRPTPPPRGPVARMDDLSDEAPVEVIDLATGPYEARFPDLARRSRARTGKPA